MIKIMVVKKIYLQKIPVEIKGSLLKEVKKIKKF